MHHCNVDRIFALWQVLHPDQWVTASSAGSLGTFTIAPNSEVDADTRECFVFLPLPHC